MDVFGCFWLMSGARPWRHRWAALGSDKCVSFMSFSPRFSYLGKVVSLAPEQKDDDGFPKA